VNFSSQDGWQGMLCDLELFVPLLDPARTEAQGFGSDLAVVGCGSREELAKSLGFSVGAKVCLHQRAGDGECVKY
jgi:hypothetical protein